MTGKDLIKFITENKLENSTVYIGCQGYMNEYNSNFDEDIYIHRIGNYLLIHDTVYYETLYR